MAHPRSHTMGRGLARAKSRAAVDMTQQYLAGELSLILGELQVVATNGTPPVAALEVENSVKD